MIAATLNYEENRCYRGAAQSKGSILLLTFPKIYFDVAENYQGRWLEESGQRLENIDQTHLVLASGKTSTTKPLCITFLYYVG